jgi:hypothetical protein
MGQFLHAGLFRAPDGLELLQGGVHDGTDAGMAVSVLAAAEGNDNELTDGQLADGANCLEHPSIQEIIQDQVLDLEVSDVGDGNGFTTVDFVLGALLYLERGHA